MDTLDLGGECHQTFLINVKYLPSNPNCCFHISALDGEGTGLLPTILGL